MKKLSSLLIGIIISLSVQAQTTTENIETAFNAGSAKELIKHFNNITEVKINDVGANYSKLQAEPIIKDFFKENPPASFRYIHKGQSPEGLKYNIGMYQSKEKSYRVVILLKEKDGAYIVDTINLNED